MFIIKEVLWKEIKSKHHNIAVHTFVRSLHYNIFFICLFQQRLIFQIEYMETSCQLLQLQEDISSLIKERECIDQRIKEKQFEEKQLQRSNLRFLKIVSKTKSSHNYSPEKQGIKPTTPIKPSVKTTSEPGLKFEV